MKVMDNYMPREYLALRINYCRQQLEQLPLVKLGSLATNGTQTTLVKVGSHKYEIRSENGKKYYQIWLLRDELERQLRMYESLWNLKYVGCVPTIEIPKRARTIWVSNNTPVAMNKNFFDSLPNDANKDHPKPPYYFYNGIYYRSAAERSIAIFYTEAGIPFKYEPAVMLAGLRKPVFPDFVPYFRELDSCIFHEHFGMMNSSDYIRDSKIKFTNFVNAGLLQDLDYIFTYNDSDTVLDPRFLSAKINTLIIGSVVCRVE